MAGPLNKRSRSDLLGRARSQPMCDINVTPLVDVMLVLLVIFMITAPLMTAGVQVDLPAVSASAIEAQEQPVTVTVSKDGHIYLQDTEVTLEKLTERLNGIVANNKDVRVFVRGDQGIAYGQVMTVVGTIHDAGFQKVALLTQPVESPSSGKRTAARSMP